MKGRPPGSTGGCSSAGSGVCKGRSLFYLIIPAAWRILISWGGGDAAPRSRRLFHPLYRYLCLCLIVLISLVYLFLLCIFFFMIREPTRIYKRRSSAALDGYKKQTRRWSILLQDLFARARKKSCLVKVLPYTDERISQPQPQH